MSRMIRSGLGETPGAPIASANSVAFRAQPFDEQLAHELVVLDDDNGRHYPFPRGWAAQAMLPLARVGTCCAATSFRQPANRLQA